VPVWGRAIEDLQAEQALQVFLLRVGQGMVQVAWVLQVFRLRVDQVMAQAE
jgi:hypothetical protein